MRWTYCGGCENCRYIWLIVAGVWPAAVHEIYCGVLQRRANDLPQYVFLFVAGWTATIDLKFLNRKIFLYFFVFPLKDQMVNYTRLAWKLTCMLRTYRTYNLTVWIYKKLLSGVTLFRVTLYVTWIQLIYIYINRNIRTSKASIIYTTSNKDKIVMDEKGIVPDILQR